jgi:hypothetical protein
MPCCTYLTAQLPAVSDEHMLALNFLLGKNFQKALAILDKGAVTCYIGERTARRVYQVRRKPPALACDHRPVTTSASDPVKHVKGGVHGVSVSLLLLPSVLLRSGVPQRSPLRARPSHLVAHLRTRPAPCLTVAPCVLQCKHQIAARLAAATARCNPTVVPDLVIAQLLCSV